MKQYWFNNSMLVNIEVWNNGLGKDIDTLIDFNRYLMKIIINTHSKASVKLLYLDSSAIQLNYILGVRRINYIVLF